MRAYLNNEDALDILYEGANDAHYATTQRGLLAKAIDAVSKERQLYVTPDMLAPMRDAIAALTQQVADLTRAVEALNKGPEPLDLSAFRRVAEKAPSEEEKPAEIAVAKPGPKPASAP